MNSTKQYMNGAKQCVNSEPMWGYCSRAKKKRRKRRREETRNPNGTYSSSEQKKSTFNWTREAMAASQAVTFANELHV